MVSVLATAAVVLAAISDEEDDLLTLLGENLSVHYRLDVNVAGIQTPGVAIFIGNRVVGIAFHRHEDWAAAEALIESLKATHPYSNRELLDAVVEAVVAGNSVYETKEEAEADIMEALSSDSGHFE